MKNDGGPAFPESRGTGNIPGMTLRDYFAAAVLQGLISGDGPKILEDASKECGLSPPEFLARSSYQQADAMIAERDK